MSVDLRATAEWSARVTFRPLRDAADAEALEDLLDVLDEASLVTDPAAPSIRFTLQGTAWEAAADIAMRASRMVRGPLLGTGFDSRATGLCVELLDPDP